MRENESGREKRRNWKRAAEERREKPGADSRGAEQIKTAEAEAAEKGRTADYTRQSGKEPEKGSRERDRAIIIIVWKGRAEQRERKRREAEKI